MTHGLVSMVPSKRSGALAKRLVAAVLGALLLAGCSTLSFLPKDLRFVAAGTLTGHKGAVFDLALSPSGSLLASAGEDDTVRIWDLGTGKETRTLAHPDDVTSVAFSPSGEIIGTACRDALVRLFALDSEGAPRELRGHSTGVSALAFSPDGTLVASAGQDLSVRIWDVKTGGPIGVLTGHTESVQDVAFSPDGTMIASASSDETVRLWRLEDLSLLKVMRNSRPLERVSEFALSFSADSSLLLSGGGRGHGDMPSAIREWSIPSGSLKHAYPSQTREVWSVGYLGSGAYVAAAGTDATVFFWSSASGAPVGTIAPGAGAIWSMVWSRDGSALYLATAKRGILIYHRLDQ